MSQHKGKKELDHVLGLGPVIVRLIHCKKATEETFLAAIPACYETGVVFETYRNHIQAYWKFAVSQQDLEERVWKEFAKEAYRLANEQLTNEEEHSTCDIFIRVAVHKLEGNRESCQIELHHHVVLK